MFVVLRWPAAGYGPQTPAQQERTEVWQCETAAWESGALVMTHATLQPASPTARPARIIMVPWQGTTIEIRES